MDGNRDGPATLATANNKETSLPWRVVILRALPARSRAGESPHHVDWASSRSSKKDPDPRCLVTGLSNSRHRSWFQVFCFAYVRMYFFTYKYDVVSCTYQLCQRYLSRGVIVRDVVGDAAAAVGLLWAVYTFTHP